MIDAANKAEREPDDADDLDGRPEDDNEEENTPDWEEFKDVHTEALERFKRAVEAEADMRQAAEEDIRFRNGDQWPQDLKKGRSAERPTLTINRTDAYARRVVNNMLQNMPRVKVTPGDSKASVKVAKVYNGIIRAIQRNSSAEKAYETVADQMVGSSFGHARVCTKYADDDGFTQEIVIERIPNQFTVYSDPDAREAAWEDADFRFVTEMVMPKDFKAEHGFTPKSFSELGSPQEASAWFDGDKVRVAEYWRVVRKKQVLYLMPDGKIVRGVDPVKDREMLAQLPPDQLAMIRSREVELPVVEQYMMTGEGVFKKSDYKGKFIPIASAVGREYWIDGKRHLKSHIRDVKDVQRMYNYWASSETEQVALQTKIPVMVPKGAIDDPEIRKKWMTMNTTPHPFIEFDVVNGMMPQRIEGPSVGAGLREGRIMAIEDMKAVLDQQDPTMGRPISGDASGIAVENYQRQGDVATFDFTQHFGNFVCQIGKILVDLIPVVYDGPRIARMLEEDGTPSMQQINAPTVVQGVDDIFDVRVGKYDVSVELGPSFQTQREETLASQLDALAKMPNLWGVIGDLVVKNTNWPQSDEIAQRIRRSMDPAILGEGPPPALKQKMAAMGQQIQQMQGYIQKLQQHITEQQFDVQKHALDAKAKETSAQASMAKASVDVANAQLEAKKLGVDTFKARAETMLDLMELRLKEMEVVADAMGHAVDFAMLQQNVAAARAQLEGFAAPIGLDPTAPGAMMQ